MRVPANAPPRPDVPAAMEAGAPDLTIEGLVGLFGPRNLRIEVSTQLQGT